MAGPADEIIVQLTADASQLAAGMQEGVAAVQEGSDAMAAAGASGAAEAVASTQTVADAYAAMAARVTEALGEYASGFDAVYAIQAELDAQMAAGTLTADAYAQSLDMLDAQTAALTASVTADAAAINAQTLAMQASAGAAAEDGAAMDADTVATESNVAAKGHYIGIFGLLGRAMGFIMTPAGMATAAIAALGIDAAQQSGRVSGLKDALIVTGDAAGVTTGQIDAWSASIGNTIGTVGDAQAAFQKLAQSGQFAGSELKQAGDAAEIFSELTDTSSTQAASAIERMATDPVSALRYLTSAQQDVVRSLLDVGDKAEAGRVAVADFAEQMQHAAEQAKGDIGVFTRLGDAIANAWDKTGRSLDVATGGGTVEQQIALLRAQRAQQHSVNPTVNAEMNASLDAQIAKLEAVKNAQAQAAKEAAVSHDFVHTPSGWGKAGLAADEQTVKSTEADQKMGYAQRVAYEKEYWTHILSIATKGSDEYIAAYEKLQGALGGHHPKAPYVAAADAGWNVGSMDSLDRGLMAQDYKPIQAFAANQKQSWQLDQVDTSATAAHASAQVALHQSINEQRVAMGSMSKADMLAQEATLQDGLYQLRLAGLQKELALESDRPVAAAKTVAQIQALEDNHAQKMQAISAQTTALQVSDWQSIISPITQAFGGIVTGYVQGTLTMQQAEQRMGSAILAESVNFGVQKLAHWTAVELAKTMVTEQGTAERLALEAKGFLQSTLLHAEAAVKWIVTEAAKAAAGAFSALAGIPIIGPALAVGASIAAGAAVLGLVGKVASAEGGWDRVPQDGMQTILHKDEMVLPADLAEGVRNMSGGGGGQTHVHIHAMDSSSFETFLKRNPQALMRALGSAHRTGYATA